MGVPFWAHFWHNEHHRALLNHDWKLKNMYMREFAVKPYTVRPVSPSKISAKWIAARNLINPLCMRAAGSL
ncbi:MAG: hypothetical protein ACKO96_00265, partial [Flammeovirgaceae bacterium]